MNDFFYAVRLSDGSLVLDRYGPLCFNRLRDARRFAQVSGFLGAVFVKRKRCKRNHRGG